MMRAKSRKREETVSSTFIFYIYRSENLNDNAGGLEIKMTLFNNVMTGRKGKEGKE